MSTRDRRRRAVEATLPNWSTPIPSAMRDSAMQFVAEAGGYVTYRIEGRCGGSKYPFPGGLRTTCRPEAFDVRWPRPIPRCRLQGRRRGDAPRFCTRVGVDVGGWTSCNRGGPMRGVQRLAGSLLRHRREASDRRRVCCLKHDPIWPGAETRASP